MEVQDSGRGARVRKKRCEQRGWGLMNLPFSSLPHPLKEIP